MEKLAHLLKLTQEELKTFLYKYLKEKNMLTIFDDGYIYVEGNIPILLVAHMDTVFDEPPKNLYYDRKNDKIFSREGGIGGDDRCGVYAIMKILEQFRPHVLFTEDEEIGGVGAEKTVEKLPKPNVKYIIEFDRRGSNDCVFYDCGNDEFMHYVESFGFVTEYGTFSDISVLGSAWDIGAVNLSSGYYNEHTKNEYIKFKELEHNINRVKSMLKKHKKAPYFDYQEIKYTPQGHSIFYDNWSEGDFMEWLSKFYRTSTLTETQSDGKKLVLRKEKDSESSKGDK